MQIPSAFELTKKKNPLNDGTKSPSWSFLLASSAFRSNRDLARDKSILVMISTNCIQPVTRPFRWKPVQTSSNKLIESCPGNYEKNRNVSSAWIKQTCSEIIKVSRYHLSPGMERFVLCISNANGLIKSHRCPRRRLSLDPIWDDHQPHSQATR